MIRTHLADQRTAGLLFEHYSAEENRISLAGFGWNWIAVASFSFTFTWTIAWFDTITTTFIVNPAIFTDTHLLSVCGTNNAWIV